MAIYAMLLHMDGKTHLACPYVVNFGVALGIFFGKTLAIYFLPNQESKRYSVRSLSSQLVKKVMAHDHQVALSSTR